ncbi:4-hydroxy-tetrahydrodipicolinate reductase [Dissostichus eleginoides]|uniref:4-hydroxy-tetrahydrodipicolinate reductase n=1 Tax=Dissostichus eleginoides TaxID=100907 RepID=A0AAD9EUN5_DISEL|nr:4-hydroxy-tetrahydrodipicolinate reductase [Dissostichus eleginoides]KAK1877731.1 4-hydroxy-tetrahydrodipicolinate reductase [Dissostichus eleginoides]
MEMLGGGAEEAQSVQQQDNGPSPAPILTGTHRDTRRGESAGRKRRSNRHPAERPFLPGPKPAGDTLL